MLETSLRENKIPLNPEFEAVKQIFPMFQAVSSDQNDISGTVRNKGIPVRISEYKDTNALKTLPSSSEQTSCSFIPASMEVVHRKRIPRKFNQTG
ncbi:hypothetical protein V6N13_073069 [Hibiscus sabdariffa]